jgi:DNA-binding transcriptional LysR family regulator
MLPDIDSLALFVRAAELHSLSKAADASHIGVAAASRRIALLEHRFKTPLLERSPRGVELTAAGVSLLAHAKSLLVQLNEMNAEMSDHAEGRRGALRILANTSAMTEFLPGDLAAFAEANPDIRLVVEERWSAEIVRRLLAGEGDLGIVMEGNRTEGLVAFPYRRDRLCVVAPQGHPLLALAGPRFEDVLDHDIIALESSSSMMRLVTEQAVVLEKALHLRVQVRSFEAVCRMVQAGLGVGLLPFQAANALAEGMSLIARPLSEAWAERQMLVCVKQDRAPKRALERLLDHLKG